MFATHRTPVTDRGAFQVTKVAEEGATPKGERHKADIYFHSPNIAVRILSSLIILKTLSRGQNYYIIACENIRFSSLFAAGDVPRETSPSAKSEEKRMFSQANYTMVVAVK